MSDSHKQNAQRRNALSSSLDLDNSEVRARVRSVVKDQPTRPDPRSERTVEEILEATFRLLGADGGEKLTIRSVCKEADISRGTFYRYFESKEDLMDSATRYLRDLTDVGVFESVEGITDPKKRFVAFVKFAVQAPATATSSHLLDTEPEFMLRYFRENFSHFKLRVGKALTPVYDVWERDLGAKLNRELVSELFVRFALSATMVPTDESMQDMAAELRKVAKLIRSAPTPSAEV